MSETLTYQESEPSPDNTVVLSSEEQESLQIGEEMAQEQSTLLAGKYDTPQALEKAYLELQSKLGSNEEKTQDAEPEPEPEPKAEENSEKQVDTSFLDQLWEESQNDSKDYSSELMDKLNSMSKEDLASMYLEQRSNQSESNEPVDFTDDQVSQLQGLVGGAEQYGQMLSWAKDNVDANEVELFDSVMNGGDAAGAYFAIRAMSQRWVEAQGYEGDLIQGKAPRSENKQFRSQAELVQAMSDPRYDTDEAYRSDVLSKLSNSNLDF